MGIKASSKVLSAWLDVVDEDGKTRKDVSRIWE